MIEIERFLEGAKQMFTIWKCSILNKNAHFQDKKCWFQVEIADSSHEKGIFLIEIDTF